MKAQARGFGTVYRQPGSRFWWVQYWHEGKRRRESSNSEKLKDAQALLKTRLAETAAGEGTDPHPPVLAMRELYDSLERDYLINRKKSIRNIRNEWNLHLQPHFGALATAHVDAKAVELYIAKRQSERASNATINRELAALKRMFKLAVRTGALNFGQRPYIPTLEERNVRKGFVKNAQYDALARETGKIGLWLRAMFEVGFVYGWRKSELLELRVRQVDLVERTIALDPGETKNDEGRLVEMTGTVFELLRQCVQQKGPEEHVFTRPARPGGLFRAKGSRFWWIQYYRAGKAIRESSKLESEAEARELLRTAAGAGLAQSKRPVVNFVDDWARATAAAGCPGLLFHDLRRSGVRNMIRAGVTEKIAMTISGHKTRSVFERYNIVDPADLHEAAGKMNRAAHARRQRELFEQGEMFGESSELSALGSQPNPPATEPAPRKPAASAPAADEPAGSDRHSTAIAAPSRRPN